MRHKVKHNNYMATMDRKAVETIHASSDARGRSRNLPGAEGINNKLQALRTQQTV